MPSIILWKRSTPVRKLSWEWIVEEARKKAKAEGISFDAAMELLVREQSNPKETTTEKGSRMRATTAWDEIERLAKEKLERKECPTWEQAIVKVCADNPALRQRYHAEPRPEVVVKTAPTVQKHWSLIRLEEMAQALRTESREPITKEEAMVRITKTDAGRQLAQAYREHQRQAVRA
jgi:hypothetical protein